MSLVKWAFIGLILLPLAEIVAFILIAIVIGWFWATGLFLATTLAGLLVLRRAGRRDFDRLRAEFGRDGFAAVRLDGPNLGPIAGGILLVFPGFITDLLGALLLVPAIRRRLGAIVRGSIKTQREPQRSSVVDLASDEWRQVSETAIEDGLPRKTILPRKEIS
jgi:UPF0716 protein FxsA